MVTLSEQLLTLSAAARDLPSLRGGRGINVSTIWRWALRGIRGVRLETCLVGGIRYTSTEALERFVRATTAAADGAPSSGVRSSRRRQRDIEAVERESAVARLAEHGLAATAPGPRCAKRIEAAEREVANYGIH